MAARVEIEDRFAFGRTLRTTQRIDATALAVFTVRWPPRSAFRLTQITVRPMKGGGVDLVPLNSPLYAWQAKLAYEALAAYAARYGIRLRVGDPPKFDAG